MTKKISKKPVWNPKRIRSLRLALSETQETFAQRLGVSFVTVSRWEQAHSAPSRLAQQRLDELEAQG